MVTIMPAGEKNGQRIIIVPSPLEKRRYGVHNIFGPTIQGEGPYAGVSCVFVRFSGCNMWDGRPETRAASKCPFCDTDFFSHTKMSGNDIVEEVERIRKGAEWIWLSGGEPLLQLDAHLLNALKKTKCKIAVETNGTVKLGKGIELGSRGIDLLTVSPKLPQEGIVIKKAHVLKVLYPHPNPAIVPMAYTMLDTKWRFIQPVDAEGDSIRSAQNAQAAAQFVLDNPEWRISLQMHKYLGVK